MLALTTCVLCADLLAVDTLHRQTLPARQYNISWFALRFYLVFFFGAELHESGMDVVQWRRRKIRCAGFRLRLRGWALGMRGWRRRARRCGGWAGRRHGRAVLQRLQRGLQWGLHRSGMRVDTVRNQGTIGSRNGRACWARRRGGRAIRSARVSVGRADAIGGLGGLRWLRRVGVTT